MNAANVYSIPLATLTPGQHSLSFPLGEEFMRLYPSDDITALDAVADVTVDYHNDAYRIDMLITGSLGTPCHRCLDTVTLPLDEEYTVVATYGEEDDDSGLGEGGTPEDPDRIVVAEQHRSLDIGPLIRDTLLLAIPLRCVHPDGECNPEIASRIAPDPEDTDE